jgi:hypothetical protein
MIIRDAQLDSIATSRFLERVADVVFEAYPESRSELASEEGRRILREQCEKARSYGFVSELDIARYIITAWLLGVDFDTKFPAMQEVLTDPELEPGKKADLIEQFSVTLFETLQAGGE